MKNKQLKYKIIISLFVFLFFMIFYLFFHPIYLSDTDDWLYIYFHRSPFPSWGSWNPTRVLAEVLMPLVSLVSAKVFMPLTHDLIISLSIGYALLISSLMAILSFMLIGLLGTNKCKSSVAFIIFFIISHFWIFRSGNSHNMYMLWTIDACTYFYYVIPNILNCILTIWIMTDSDITTDFFKKEKYYKKSIFIALLYFATYSNIWSSVITMAYVGSLLTLNLINSIKNKSFNLVNYIKNNCILLITFILWLSVQILEAFGGRSKSLSEGITYSASLKKTISSLLSLIPALNMKFALVIALIVLGGIVLIIVNKSQSTNEILLRLAISMILTTIYIVLTCAKTGAHYIERADVIYGIFFYGMLIAGNLLLTIFDRFPLVKCFLPLIMLIAIFDCNTADITYRNCNIRDWEPKTSYSVASDIITQMKAAEENNINSTDIYIPIFESESNDNWPYSVNSAETFSQALYRYGITSYKIQIDTLVPSENKNEALHVSL